MKWTKLLLSLGLNWRIMVEGKAEGQQPLADSNELVDTISEFVNGLTNDENLSKIVSSAVEYVLHPNITSSQGTNLGSRYIIRLDETCEIDEYLERLAEMFPSMGYTVHGILKSAIQGIIVDFGDIPFPKDLVEKLPCILMVEQDMPMKLYGQIQEQAPWGLDRIDQSNSELDHSFTFDLTGEGVALS